MLDKLIAKAMKQEAIVKVIGNQFVVKQVFSISNHVANELLANGDDYRNENGIEAMVGNTLFDGHKLVVTQRFNI